MRYSWLALLWALAVLIGQPSTVRSDPVFEAIRVENDAARILTGVTRDQDGTLYYVTNRYWDPFIYSLHKEASGEWKRQIIQDTYRSSTTFETGLAYDPESRSLFGMERISTGISIEYIIFKLNKVDWSTYWRRQDLVTFKDRPPHIDALSISAGKLYGATKVSGGGSPKCGSIFEVSPISGSHKWTLETIVRFNEHKEICKPTGVMAVGADGSLYGSYTRTHASPSACGGVFRLIPPQNGGAWGVEVIHKFDRKGPCSPQGVTMGAGGKLYGGTYGAGEGQLNQTGALYELTPPETLGGKWTYKKLYQGDDGFSFNANVAIGPDGSLYGPASKDVGKKGVPKTDRIFRLTPPAEGKTKWKMTYIANRDGHRSSENPVVVTEDSTVIGTSWLSITPGVCRGCSVVYTIKQ